MKIKSRYEIDQAQLARMYAEAGIPFRLTGSVSGVLKPAGIDKQIHQALMDRSSCAPVVAVVGRPLKLAQKAGIYIGHQVLWRSARTERPLLVRRVDLFKIRQARRERKDCALRAVDNVFAYADLLILNDVTAEVRSMWTEEERWWLQYKISSLRSAKKSPILICTDASLSPKELREFFRIMNVDAFTIRAAQEVQILDAN